MEEYRHRVEELKRLVSTLNEEAKGSEMLNQIALLEGAYEPENFRGDERAGGLSGGRRALLYLLRAAAAGSGEVGGRGRL